MRLSKLAGWSAALLALGCAGGQRLLSALLAGNFGQEDEVALYLRTVITKPTSAFVGSALCSRR
jgi:hypothetical protein